LKQIFNTGIPYFDQLKAWDGVIEYKLDNPRKLVAELGNPQDQVKVVHVAGTNGKGSVCCYLASVLQASGEKNVGLHCSPHLTDICERVIINGRPVSRDRFIEASEAVREAANSCSVQPSFFEAVVASVFWLAREEKFSWLVLETGLGGRLDATNLVKRPELCIITNIGFDHTRVLGETFKEIALEKAGIIKEGSRVLLGELQAEAKDAILEYATQKVSSGNICSWSEQFSLGKDQSVLPGGREVSSSLFFEDSFSASRVHNKFLAAAAAEIIGVGDFIESGIRAARWPGRFEVFREGEKVVIVDVAHNPDSIKSFLEATDNFLAKAGQEPERVGILVSMLGRKEWKPMLDSLVARFPQARFIFTSSSHPHSLRGKELAEHYPSSEVEEDPVQAFKSFEDEDLLLVCGSLFLAGEVRPLVSKAEFRTFQAL